MNRRGVFALAAALAIGSLDATAASSAPGGSPAAIGSVDRHHYSLTARVRPLLLFWISRSNVGDAVVTRRRAPGVTGYSLLIGSDPDRAPRRINRWGYIDEEVRDGAATLIGLMTESDAASIEEAEATLRAQATGRHVFKIIRTTVDSGQSRSIVTSLRTPEDFSLRQFRTVLRLAEQDSAEGGKARTVRLPADVRPGFLSALAELIHAQAVSPRERVGVRPAGPLTYVYHGRLYELRAIRTQQIPSLTAGPNVFSDVIAAEFENRSVQDGELTRFSLTYGTTGALAEIPLTISYRPRWWMQIDLALDDEVRLASVTSP